MKEGQIRLNCHINIMINIIKYHQLLAKIKIFMH